MKNVSDIFHEQLPVALVLEREARTGDFDFATRRCGGFEGCSFLGFAYRRGDGKNGDGFVTEDFDAGRCYHLADVNGLTDFQPSSSMQTPITARPRPLYFLWNSIYQGISVLHPWHQAAQKSSSTTLPL